jgi:hypothetical protein
MLPIYPRIAAVEVRRPYVLKLRFKDDSEGEVDLWPVIRGQKGLFIPLQDPEFFGQVRVDPESGTVVWPNGVDLDPDVLYHKAHRNAETR